VSIKVKILSWQAILVVTACAATGLTALHLTVSSLTQSQLSRLQVIAQDHAQQIAARLAAKAAVMERIAAGAAVSEYAKTYNDPALAQYLSKFTKEFPSLAYVNEEGTEELKLQDGRRAEQLENVSGTELFQDALWERNKVHTMLRVKDVEPAKASLGFAICRKSFFDEFEGAVIGWVPLSDILTDVRQRRIDKTGFLAVMDDQGTLLSYPRGDRLLQKVTAEGKHSEQVLADAASMKAGRGRANLVGIDGYVAYSPVPGRNWVVFATLPVGEFMAAPEALKNVVMGVTAAVLVMCIIVSALIAKTITTALSKLAAVSGALAKGDLSQRAAVATRDEVGALAGVFNHMAEHLQGAIEKLNDEIKDRKKAQTELAKTNEQLRQTQSDLVQSEKMGVLGVLAAGVAHEINTPVGAIMNVCSDISRHLLGLVHLEMALSELHAETRQWLSDVLSKMPDKWPPGSWLATRAEQDRVQQRLRDLGLEGERRLIDVILYCGLADEADYSGMLRHLSQEPVLSFLEHVVAMRAAAEISTNSAAKITRIVRALKFYARDDENPLAEIGVNESIEDTLVILQNRFKWIAKVKVDFCQERPTVRSGPDLAQVWTNILNNACDAIEASRTEGPGTIEVTTRCADGQVVVTIANEGPPIPPESIGKIFDPFFTTKPVGKGTGLGLSICAGILRRCGGTISARNEPGRVVFVVSLPVAEGERTAKAPPGQASAIRAT
jgi:C4-dicarboxylate-specific signal transduction histidine kinase